MKNLIRALCVVGLCVFFSCGEDRIEPDVDPSIQRAIDVDLIEQYFSEKGYSNVDTTESGVRYVIIDKGDGEEIDESDIVTFNYVGRLLNDTIFDTSIKSMVDSIRMVVSEDSTGLDDTSVHNSILLSFPEMEEDSPFVITYSVSGWPFNGNYVQGFSDGIIASFDSRKINSIGVGGKVLIAVPSDLAYGEAERGFFIKPNTPLIFELYPIKVEKQ